jgi:hypothetical protein
MKNSVHIYDAHKLYVCATSTLLELIDRLKSAEDEIKSLLKAIDDHDCNKITVDGKLLLAIDHAQELVDSIK